MIVMPGYPGPRVRSLAARYPGRVGLLFSPGGQRGRKTLPAGLSYCLDNGAFGGFDETEWLKLCDWAKQCGRAPAWALCPDVVADAAGTLRFWRRYSGELARYGWPLAFAVQDGMTPADVPKGVDVIFVGGSTRWKWRSLGLWCGYFPRVHVGRVNSYARLWAAHSAGVESVDGTGWMRGGDDRKFRGLVAYLKESSGEVYRNVQLELLEASA